MCVWLVSCSVLYRIASFVSVFICLRVLLCTYLIDCLCRCDTYIYIHTHTHTHTSGELFKAARFYFGARCSSALRAFAHGAMDSRIDTSWWNQRAISRLWYVLSCLWDDAYKRTLAANRKEYPM